MTWEFSLIFSLFWFVPHPTEVEEQIGKWAGTLLLARVNFQSIVPVSTAPNSPVRLRKSPMSSPGEILHIFESKGLIFNNFFLSVMWMVIQVQEKQILIFQFKHFGLIQRRKNFPPISELDINFLHVLVYAQSDRSWRCDKSTFIEEKNNHKLIGWSLTSIQQHELSSVFCMLITFPDLEEWATKPHSSCQIPRPFSKIGRC